MGVRLVLKLRRASDTSRYVGGGCRRGCDVSRGEVMERLSFVFISVVLDDCLGLMVASL